MTPPLRIMLTADPELPVPPKFYGGIERIIALLAEGLTSRGHDVVLIANEESTAPGRLVPYPRTDSRVVSRIVNTAAIGRAAACHRPDVIHSFGRLASLAATFSTAVPKIMSYQREITPRSVALGLRLGGGQLTFTACSNRMLTGVRHMTPWRVIYNAVDTDRYQFSAGVGPDAPLIFLGRVEPNKGPQVAIEIARRTGRRLIIAGNVPAEHQEFFDTEIKPFLDGHRTQYLGPVDDRAKHELLSTAAALLMPIQWEEPFGIVMAEALACGTPVIGLSRGAVPEVVTHGLTGFVCDTVDEMHQAVADVGVIDRATCRAAAESRFSRDVLVDAYVSLYREVMMSAHAQQAAVAKTGPRPVPTGGSR